MATVVPPYSHPLSASNSVVPKRYLKDTPRFLFISPYKKQGNVYINYIFVIANWLLALVSYLSYRYERGIDRKKVDKHMYIPKHWTI